MTIDSTNLAFILFAAFIVTTLILVTYAGRQSKKAVQE